jgi:hypothetical protein
MTLSGTLMADIARHHVAVIAALGATSASLVTKAATAIIPNRLRRRRRSA